MAQKALKRGTGARGLRSILETMMTDIMFDLPNRDDVREVVITKEAITEGTPPLVVTERARDQAGGVTGRRTSGRAVRRSSVQAGPRSGSGGRLATAPQLVRPSAPPCPPLPVEFVGTFPDPLVILSPALPEIAFIGRSNVGKSSLLNALVGRPGLARVSATPGKTTLLNVFRLPGFYLVDLPGYGFARAGKTARAGYRRLVDRYLRERPTLAGVVWLLDVRHQPSQGRPGDAGAARPERPAGAAWP